MIMMSIATRWFVDHPEHETIWRELLTTWQNDEQVRSMVTTFGVITNNGMADIVHHG